jgi:hypothetical protein
VFSTTVFRNWSSAAYTSAHCKQVLGDELGHHYATIRARAYAEAADIAKDCLDSDTAARVIYNIVKTLRSRAIPFGGFDAAADQHLRCIALQKCAQLLDPDLPTLEDSWT